MTTKITTDNIAPTALATLGSAVPKVSTITYPGTETATDTAGGETITLTGTGFNSGATVIVNGTSATVVTVVSSTSLTFTAPAQSAGTYVIYVINTDGGTALVIPGLSYSGTPNWSTSAGSLGSAYESASISNTVTATGDTPITYSLDSGSLPTGSTINSSSGLISGTAPTTASSTTYTFTIKATDPQNQTTNRSFSLTINPDVITWSAPANNSTTTAYEYSAITPVTLSASSAAGQGITYTANSLPTGISLSGSTISGTPTVVANTTTLLTSTGNTTSRTATRTVNFVVNQDVVTWSSPADNTTTTLTTNTAMSNVTMSATSAAGKSITYTANSLPTGLSISGADITGTPTVSGNSSSLITATASTTNRTATRTFNWVVSVANDTYWKNTTLLLNGETTSTPFISDASSNSFGLTIAGDTKPVLFNPYTPGYYSNYFDGTGDYLTVTSNAAFQLGTDSYTFETWIYPTALGSNNTNNILNIGTFSTGLMIRGAATTGIEIYTNNTQRLLTATGLTQNAWQHIALVRNGSACTFYVNGISIGTFTDSSSISPATATVTIGMAAHNSSEFFTGYMSNYRLVKGTAVYTSAFTPSTTPLTAIANTSLLTCQSNRLIDTSTNAFTITKNGDTTVSPVIPFTANSSYSTYGSTYFDGSGDYLSIANNSAFSLSSGSYTIEFWAYWSSISGEQVLIERFSAPSGPGYTLYKTNSGNNIQLYGSSTVLTSSTAVVAGTWYHIAITYNGSTTRLFINGIQDASSASNIGDASTTLYIGSRTGGSVFFNGYMSDVRIVKGTAVYTTTFTPTITPLTAIANTSLLTLQYNGSVTNQAIIDNSNFNNIITRAGNASQGTFSPYSVTGWSNYFNGSSTYITSPSTTTNAFGTGDYTIEFWCYSNSLGSSTAGCMFYVDMNGYSQLIRHNGSVWECYYKSGVSFSTVSTSTVGINQWVHHALVRNSGTVKWYINGVQYGSASDATNFSSSTYFQMGMFGTYYYDGYLSNVRVVKGTAVYTSAFTPPTSPLTAISGTIFLTAQSNRFIDNGPLNQTITLTSTPTVQAFSPFGSISEATPLSYSVYFDGTSDVYSIAGNAGPIGTEDFTWECWAYITTMGGQYPRLFESATSVASSFQVYLDSGTLTVAANGGGAITTYSISTLTNQWLHLCVTRTGSALRLFVNGVLRGYSGSGGNNFPSGGSSWKAATEGGGYIGYLSNMRIVRGSIVSAYSTASTTTGTTIFTPPTTQLTAISGTQFLGMQSARLIDNSTNAYVISTTGDTKPYKYNPFGYTAQTATSYTPSIHGGSMYALNTSSYVSTSTIGAGQAFGTGDFTVEFWMYSTAASHNVFAVSSSTNAWSVVTYLNALYWQFNGGNAQSGGSIVLNMWSHFAISRISGVTKGYINGVQVFSAADTNNYSGTPTLVVGPNGGGTAGQYISDVRITKGYAIYPTNFVPPVQSLTNYSTTYPATLLLNFTNGGIIDQHNISVFETVGNTQLSTSVKKYNNASMYFDGTGDYLLAPGLATYTFGTGDFTIEAWIYRTDTGVQRAIVDNSAGTSNRILFYITSNNKLNLFDGSSVWLSSTNTVTANQWVHVAVARSSGTTKLFIGGTQEASSSDTRNYIQGSAGLYIGRQYGTTINDFMGYIDDLRITNGYARYTGAYTPPTSALITK